MFDQQSSEMPWWPMGNKKERRLTLCSPRKSLIVPFPTSEHAELSPKPFPGKKSHRGSHLLHSLVVPASSLSPARNVMVWTASWDPLESWSSIMEYPELEGIHRKHWAQLLALDRTIQNLTQAKKINMESVITSQLIPSIPSWTIPAVLLFFPALLSPAPGTSMELAGGGLEPWASDRARSRSGAQEVAPCNRKSE